MNVCQTVLAQKGDPSPAGNKVFMYSCIHVLSDQCNMSD